MKFTLAPKVGALPLRFGMTASEVKHELANAEVPSAFRGMAVSKLDALGVHPAYSNGGLHFIEFSSRSYLVYEDVDLFDPYNDDPVAELVNVFGPYQTTEFGRLLFDHFDILVWFEDDKVQSIATFTSEYRDRLAIINDR